MSQEEDRTRDAVDSEPKHYQLSYSGPIWSNKTQQKKTMIQMLLIWINQYTRTIKNKSDQNASCTVCNYLQHTTSTEHNYWCLLLSYWKEKFQSERLTLCSSSWRVSWLQQPAMHAAIMAKDKLNSLLFLVLFFIKDRLNWEPSLWLSYRASWTENSLLYVYLFVLSLERKG